MEALVGSALFTTAGGTAVGTTGLIGAAGSVGAGGSLFAGSNFFSLLSAGGSIMSGIRQAQADRMEQAQLNLRARHEELKAKETALRIKDQLDRDIASQNALFSARGMLAGEGTAAAAAEVSRRNATRDIDLARFSGGYSADVARANASISGQRAQTSLLSGFGEAAQTIRGIL